MLNYFSPYSVNKIHTISTIKNKQVLNKINQSIEFMTPDFIVKENAIVLPGITLDKDWIVKYPNELSNEDLVYDNNLQPIELARLNFFRFRPERVENRLVEKVRNGDISFENINMGIYCGIIFGHFGHFLLESFARLWVINNFEEIDKNICFIFHSHAPRFDLEFLKKRKLYEYFSILGIDESQIKIVNKPIRCKQLLIPESAFILSHGDNKLFGSYQVIDFWNKISNQVFLDMKEKIDSRKKLYFARSNLKNSTANRRLSNERELENFLRKNGFEIIFPHDLVSEKEKLELLVNADILIGLNGTGLHNAVFMREATSVVQITNSKFAHSVGVQSGICMLKKINLHTIITEPESNNPEWEIDIDKVALVLEKIGIYQKGE